MELRVVGRVYERDVHRLGAEVLALRVVLGAAGVEHGAVAVLQHVAGRKGRDADHSAAHAYEP